MRVVLHLVRLHLLLRLGHRWQRDVASAAPWPALRGRNEYLWAHIHDLDRRSDFCPHLLVEHPICLLSKWNRFDQHGHEKRQIVQRASRGDPDLLFESPRNNGSIIGNDRLLRSNFWFAANYGAARAIQEDLAKPKRYDYGDVEPRGREEIDA